MKTEQIECSETSAYKIQTPGNYPEEIIQTSCYFGVYEEIPIVTTYIDVYCIGSAVVIMQ